MRTAYRLVAVAAVLGACSSNSNPTQPNPGGGGGSSVVVSNDKFTPSDISVTTGTTITWQWNSGGVDHTVTFDDGPDSGVKSSGTFTRTFQTAGTFPYFCQIHRNLGMTGTVTVTAASTGSGGGTQTSGGGSGMGGGGSYNP
jgi:plastocyanin